MISISGKSNRTMLWYIEQEINKVMEKLNVIGQGYIGLPTTLMFASRGVPVVGTDSDKAVIEQLQTDLITFEEKGLKDLFEKATSKGVKFSSEYQRADTYILAVPTPYNKKSKKLDSTYVVSAVNCVLDVCELGAIIIIESTISPGTIDKYIRPEIFKRELVVGEDVHLVHAPERIIPGNMVYELENNARTIGADSPEIAEKVKQLYATFCKGEILTTDIRSAEMSKVVENTYRDVNIAFANELAKICHEGDMDVHEIIRLANKHPRVNILQPGPGVGGHCISVDPWFLVGDYPGLTNLILTARKGNDSMPAFVLERVSEIMKEKEMADYNRVGLYGLTYKENVDDTRESPTLQLVEMMEKNLSAPLKSYDPYIKHDIVENQYHDLNKFLSEVDLVIIMVGHDELIVNKDRFKEKIIFDTRNVFDFDGVYRL